MKSQPYWTKKLPGIFSGSFLFAVDDRVICLCGDRGQETLVALTADGAAAWTFAYPSGEHNVCFLFDGHAYLDGDEVVCLAVADGRRVAAKTFGIRLTAQPPSASGPVFWRGPIPSATGVLGLEPLTLEIAWEWQEPNAVSRGHWLCRRPKGDDVFKFARIPDLTEVHVPKDCLPPSTGRQVMFVARQNLWCAFGETTAAAIRLPDGEPTWRRQEERAEDHRIIWSDRERAYGGVTSLSAYRLADGALDWRRPAPGPLAPAASATAATGYVVSEKRLVHRVDLTNGEFTGVHEAPAEVTGIAAIDETRVVVGTSKALFCYRFD